MRFNLFSLVAAMFLSLGLFLTACSHHDDLQTQMSGVWEGRIEHETVELHLAGDSKTVVVEGHTYPTTVDALDPDRNQIRLKVNVAGTTDVWTLTQQWEDSDRFNILLQRGSKKEVLIPKTAG